jgi:nucleotide-binding universal stress UspA family protein
MNNVARILLASHGTHGAQSAERAAVDLCGPGGTLYHLLIVPEFWKGMMATDWRNQSVARNEFARHLESELEKEILEHRDRVAGLAAQRQLVYDFAMAQGDPADLLLEFARTHEVDLVVLGTPRPRGVLGFRSRMLTDDVMRSLGIPLLLVPAVYD